MTTPQTPAPARPAPPVAAKPPAPLRDDLCPAAEADLHPHLWSTRR